MACLSRFQRYNSIEVISHLHTSSNDLTLRIFNCTAHCLNWCVRLRSRSMGTIGVLALQGSFREHSVTLARCGVAAKEVRTAEELRTCDGLIIPGGESTTMAHVANTNGLFNELRDFVVTQRKPVWGTCAGLIFLAESAEGVASSTNRQGTTARFKHSFQTCR